LLAAFLTAIYTVRMLQMSFWGKARKGIHGHESPLVMTLPLMVLALLATFGGFLGVPHEWAHSMGLSGNLISDWLAPVVPLVVFDIEQAPLSEGMVSIIAVALSVLGIVIGRLMFKNNFGLPLPALGRLLEAKYFVDEFYTAVFVKPLYKVGELVSKTLEGRLLQNLGTWMGVGSSWSGDRLRTLQGGDLQVFALILLGGLSLIVAISLFWTNV
jgi:NADH-quinone oxidoreductase subunit L